MVGARSNWEDELGGWLKPFWIALAIRRVVECVRYMWQG